MRNFRTEICAASLLVATSFVALAQPSSGNAVPVTVDNYNGAQSDAYFGLIVKAGAFGKFVHARELAHIDRRGIIRPNRDTLYSLAVFDFDAGPVTVTLPDPGTRYMVMQVANEDQYTRAVYYGAGSHLAGVLHSPAPVLADLRVDQFPEMGFEAPVRASLARSHQPRIASHVGGEDRG